MGMEYLLELLLQGTVNIGVVFPKPFFQMLFSSSGSCLVSFQSLTGAVSWLDEENAKVILNNETFVKAHFHTNITSFSPDLSLNST